MPVRIVRIHNISRWRLLTAQLAHVSSVVERMYIQTPLNGRLCKVVTSYTREESVSCIHLEINGVITLILRNLHWSQARLAIAPFCVRMAPVAVSFDSISGWSYLYILERGREVEREGESEVE